MSEREREANFTIESTENRVITLDVCIRIRDGVVVVVVVEVDVVALHTLTKFIFSLCFERRVPLRLFSFAFLFHFFSVFRLLKINKRLAVVCRPMPVRLHVCVWRFIRTLRLPVTSDARIYHCENFHIIFT